MEAGVVAEGEEMNSEGGASGQEQFFLLLGETPAKGKERAGRSAQ